MSERSNRPGISDTPEPSERRLRNSNSESIELRLNIPNETEEDGITMKEILMIFKKGIGKIVMFTFIFLCIGIVSAVIYYFVSLETVGSVTGIISFNYKGAEEGLDPYGRKLDVTKIRSARVLDQALNELDLYQRDVTVEDIRQNITIDGIVPEDVMQQILVIKEMATKDPSHLERLTNMSYISTQYAITLQIPKEFGFLKSSGGIKGKELLSAIFKAYEEYFFEEYGDRSVLTDAIGSLSYDTYDYSEITEIFSGQINNMIAYLSSKRSESPNFRAKSTQMSFGDIITNLDLIKNIDVGGLQAVVTSRVLTKDRARLISIYEFQITQKTLEREVKLEEARIAQEAASTYKKDTAVMFGGTGASDSTFQFTQPSDTYDNLVKQASDASALATQLQSDIDYYQSRITDLQNAGTVSNRPADIAAAEETIVFITEKMKNWIQITNETVDEYIEAEALKDATKIVLMPQFTSSLMESLKMIAIIIIAVTMVGFVAGTVSVYVKKMMS